MKVEIGKKYRTEIGLEVELYKIYDIPSDDLVYPVRGAILDGITKLPICSCDWTLEGEADVAEHSRNSLVEVLPYAEFSIDDKLIRTMKRSIIDMKWSFLWNDHFYEI